MFLAWRGMVSAAINASPRLAEMDTYVRSELPRCGVHGDALEAALAPRGARTDARRPLQIPSSIASAKYIPTYDSEYPGYLRLPPLIQAGTQSSTPQPPQTGYFLTEVMIS